MYPSNGIFKVSGLAAKSGGFPIRMDGEWNFGYEGSLRELKTDIEPSPLAYGLLDLPGVTFRDRSEAEKDPESTRYAGFIAEDLQALNERDAGAYGPLLQHMDGRLSGIDYGRIIAYLLPIVADMNRRLTHLEES